MNKYFLGHTETMETQRLILTIDFAWFLPVYPQLVHIINIV